MEPWIEDRVGYPYIIKFLYPRHKSQQVMHFVNICKYIDNSNGPKGESSYPISM